MRRTRVSLVLLAFLAATPAAFAQPAATLIVRVVNGSAPVVDATVRAGDTAGQTDAAGEARLSVAAGRVEVVVERFGFAPRRATLSVEAGAEATLELELEPEAVLTENVLVTATRTTQRIQDLPLRVEVVPQEEIDEKLSMTPGDVAMMLTETNGLRVQKTSPSLGAANVRVQGLRGRYTQILSDGLPLYGQAGSVSVLQIPPMDLGQVEVIKGVASALYGAAALGGAINLVSRRPQAERPEREVLVNRTSLGGTDAAVWLSRKTSSRWGYTFLGGTHFQNGQDVNEDGWSDVPSYKRMVARPRVLWEDAAGRSVFLTVGSVYENRDGGTLGAATAPDGSPFRESLDTRSVDAGIVGRLPMGPSRVLTFRSSGLLTSHDHRYGDAADNDRHHTWFAETSLNGAASRHTWVVGAALQQDGFDSRHHPSFDYRYTTRSVFAQDDYAPFTWLIGSLSGRLDVHGDFGTFFSPRLSVLAKPIGGWTARLSTGTGFYVPTPFVDDIDATGLSRLAPLASLDPERGRSLSFDLGWKGGPLELTATVFGSRIEDVLLLRDLPPAAAGPAIEIVNGAGPGRTSGTELIARLHHRDVDLIVTHMYLRASEPDPDTGIRREVPLTPRHSAGIDLLWEIEGRTRLGLEAFYTGRQQLDDSPFRSSSMRHWLFGIIGEWRAGPARIFINAENLADFRQTKHVPLVLPSRAPDGRWLDDEWGPLDGRVVNAGLRISF